MNLKFSTLLIGLSALLFVPADVPLGAQQIPASELPPPGTAFYFRPLKGMYELGVRLKYAIDTFREDSVQAR